jgi:transcriptional regulator with XRE-family HTH domain
VASLRRVLAANIRRRAHERGIALNTIADFADVSRSHLHAVLGAKRSATVDWIEKVAVVLNVEPWELLKPAKRS